MLQVIKNFFFFNPKKKKKNLNFFFENLKKKKKFQNQIITCINNNNFLIYQYISLSIINNQYNLSQITSLFTTLLLKSYYDYKHIQYIYQYILCIIIDKYDINFFNLLKKIILSQSKQWQSKVYYIIKSIFN